MKVRAQTAAAALAIAGASAQAPVYGGDASSSVPAPVYGGGASSSSAAPPPASMSSPPVSYTTVTYDDCPTANIETMITVTNGYTVTYCPECEHETPAPTTKKPGHTTVYTTTYLSLCPTGTVPVTYTVTESCDEEEPTWTPGPSHVPQGFTVTVKDCTVCDGGSEKTPVPVTITEPCDCEATSGTPVAPKPTGDMPGPMPTGTPIEQIRYVVTRSLVVVQATDMSPSDGQIQNPGPTPAGNGGASSAPMPTDGSHVPSAPGSGDSGNTAPLYPTGATVTEKCPGPECQAHATGGVTGPSGGGAATPPAEGGDAPGPSTSSPAPYEGGASTYSAAGFVTMSAMIAVLALAL